MGAKGWSPEECQGWGQWEGRGSWEDGKLWSDNVSFAAGEPLQVMGDEAGGLRREPSGASEGKWEGQTAVKQTRGQPEVGESHGGKAKGLGLRVCVCLPAPLGGWH